MVLLLVMFMTAIVYAWYKAFFPTITIKYLHGHSFRQIYGRLILFNLFVNVFALFLAGIVSKKMSFYMIILCVAMSVMDYCLSRIISRCLCVKGERQFTKGDVSGWCWIRFKSHRQVTALEISVTIAAVSNFRVRRKEWICLYYRRKISQAALHLILPDRLHIMNLASTANAAGWVYYIEEGEIHGNHRIFTDGNGDLLSWPAD